MKRRIAIVTGTRAEFGLLSRIITILRANVDIECQLIATGAHLSREHGYTLSEIDAEGISIDAKVDLKLADDSHLAIAKATGRGVEGFAEVITMLKPDIIVLLGDRYEMLAAASAATMCGVPIAHIHGGEITEGAIDDAIRHAITKLSHVHFVAAQPYFRRVIQMGESPKNVFQVGALGVDLVLHMPAMTRRTIEERTGYEFAEKNIIATFHPVTLEPDHGTSDLTNLLDVLAELKHTHVAFTLPNADHSNNKMRQAVKNFATRQKHVWAFESLGFRNYISMMRHCDCVIGNSSSGIIEAPALGIRTINIGSRQRGRLRSTLVLDCDGDRQSINNAVEQVLSNANCKVSAVDQGLYGTGSASEIIANILCEIDLKAIRYKKFFDSEAIY